MVDSMLVVGLVVACGMFLRERRTTSRLRARRSRTARTLWDLRRRANDMEAAFLEVCIERAALLKEAEAKRVRLQEWGLN